MSGRSRRGLGAGSKGEGTGAGPECWGAVTDEWAVKGEAGNRLDTEEGSSEGLPRGPARGEAAGAATGVQGCGLGGCIWQRFLRGKQSGDLGCLGGTPGAPKVVEGACESHR